MADPKVIATIHDEVVVDLISSPATLTEAETLEIQERARLQLEGIVSVPYGRYPTPEERLARVPIDPGYGLDLYRTLRTWRKPQQRRPRATNMVGTGPVFVGELDIKITRIEVRPASFYFDSTLLEIHGTMPERDTGKEEVFCFAQSLDRGQHAKPMREIVRDALITFMTHEIDEQIYEVQADGKETRPFDPHTPYPFRATLKVNP